MTGGTGLPREANKEINRSIKHAWSAHLINVMTITKTTLSKFIVSSLGRVIRLAIDLLVVMEFFLVPFNDHVMHYIKGQQP